MRAELSIAPVQAPICTCFAHIQPQGHPVLHRQTRTTAKAWIDQIPMPRFIYALRQPVIADFFTRTVAGIDQTLRLQLLQSRRIGRTAGGLPQHRLVAVQAMRGQLLQLLLPPLGFATGAIHIFYTNQPRAIMGAGIQPAGQRRRQRTRVQRACRRGGKAATVIHGR